MRIALGACCRLPATGRCSLWTERTEEMANPFIDELSKRAICISRSVSRSRRKSGHAWITINLDNCDTQFVGRLDEFLGKNKDLFELHMRGTHYYVELLTCDTPEEAFSKAKL